MSSACPHYTAPEEVQLNNQHPVCIAVRAACAHHASISASRGRLYWLEHKMARSEEALSRNWIRGRTGLGQGKTG